MIQNRSQNLVILVSAIAGVAWLLEWEPLAVLLWLAALGWVISEKWIRPWLVSRGTAPTEEDMTQLRKLLGWDEEPR